MHLNIYVQKNKYIFYTKGKYYKHFQETLNNIYVFRNTLTKYNNIIILLYYIILYMYLKLIIWAINDFFEIKFLKYEYIINEYWIFWLKILIIHIYLIIFVPFFKSTNLILIILII